MATDTTPEKPKRDQRLTQKRYRMHKAGDHSICSPLRCAYARVAQPFPESTGLPHAPRPSLPTVDVPQPAESAPIASVSERYGFEKPGRALWDEMTAKGQLGPQVAILLVEACRITDRLDRLNRQLRGEDWLRFRYKMDSDSEIIMYCDRVLAEAREQATALKGLIAQIHAIQSKDTGQPERPNRTVVADGVTNLRDRIAARRNQA